jgi:NAD(P)-dependent dehydrogenase (short-subunit alcohol dehydrogenase family)
MTAALLGGRAAIVCGASHGLGREIAAELVRHGASVLLCARDPIALEDAHAHLAPLAIGDARVLARPCDISRRDQVDALVAAALAAFPELDILVNSAGVYGPKGLVEDNDWDAWIDTIEINLYGTVLLCRALVPHLKRRNYGKIIQLSGGGATQPMPRLSAYATAKAAVVRFCETLAHELAPHAIDVNCIAPGALNTRMLDEILAAGPNAVGETFYRKAVEQQASGGAPLARGAALAAWLASPASDGVTGRLISALWDPWDSLPLRRAELADSDIYTLRRIVPADRGLRWGDKP